MDTQAVKTVFDEMKSLNGIDFDAKSEQIQIATSVLNNRNVLGFLPTGFGKTLCVVIPTIVRNIKDQITHVVSPLLSLMDDQISSLHKWGFSWAKASGDMNTDTIKDLNSGRFQFVFFSPESLIKQSWKKMFLSSTWQNKVQLIAVDEAHCISEWGEDFRTEYQHIGQVRSIFNVPIMALTATSSEKVKDDIMTHLCLFPDDTDIVTKSADRPTIYLCAEKKKIKSHAKNLKWLIDHVRLNGKKSKKIIIYCRGIDTLSELFITIKDNLGIAAYAEQNEKAEHLLVEMYHKKVEQDTKNRILECFKNTDGAIRIVIATVALGMGLDIRDVDLVVHYGCPASVTSYWQEAGRCARDGRVGFSLILFDGLTLRLKTTKKDISDILKKEKTNCFRQEILDILTVGDKTVLERMPCSACETDVCKCQCCTCCYICCKKCKCSERVSFNVQHFLSN